MPEISVLVEAGKATAGAPIGPALGPLGVNIGAVVAQINEKTKPFAGMRVPVKVAVDAATKSFEISVGSPPTSALIKQELKLDKGAANPAKEVKGNISMQQVMKIVAMKSEQLSSYKMKSSVREVVGVCDSMGITVEGKKAREIQKEIAEGKFDSMLKD
jgi:large subunit ribosomal protein L11